MDVNRLLVDLCRVLDPVKRNGLRTLVQELKAKKAAREIPSVTQALLERAPAVVGADLWRECCEKQRPRGDPVPEPPDQPKRPEVVRTRATANAAAATANDDAEEAQDTLGYQVRFTNALQTKLDKLAALAKANGVDAAAVDAIKNGPNL